MCWHVWNWSSVTSMFNTLSMRTWRHYIIIFLDRATLRFRSGTHLDNYISGLQDPSFCHHHLELSRGTTYSNIIILLSNSILHNAWSLSTFCTTIDLSQLMLREVDLHMMLLPLESTFALEGAVSLLPMCWFPSSSRQLFPFLFKEVKPRKNCFIAAVILEGAIFYQQKNWSKTTTFLTDSFVRKILEFFIKY